MLRQLSLRESFVLLNKYRIPYVKPVFIESENDAHLVKSYPCVLKINSEDIVHKSDVGGIVSGIANVQELKIAHHKIIRSVRHEMPRARIHGTAAFKQESGQELFIGMKRDAQFGDVIAFGLGGIFVEVLKDVSLRITPFSMREALSMIKEIKAYKVLEGIRGRQGVSISLVADLIVRTAKMCNEHPDITEMDFNPVLADRKKAVVADVRIISKK